MTDFATLKYETSGGKAYITLNRPDRLNAIDDRMPSDIRNAVAAANDDDEVRVIVLQGAGKAFCAGYDLKEFAEGDLDGKWNQGPVWDPIKDFRGMKQNTDDFFTLWRSLKPTICKVQGYAIAGGSDHRAVLRHADHGRRRSHRIPALRVCGVARRRRCGCTGSAPSVPSECC